MSLTIIGAGQPRTGTNSLKCALDILGHGPCYHMYRLIEECPEEASYFVAARDRKPVDWNTLFTDFQSAVDFPVALYYQALLKTYPDAKIILSVRDAEAWYISISQTVFKASQPTLRRKIKTMLSLPFSKKTRSQLPIFVYVGRMIKEFYGPQLTKKEAVIERFNRWNTEVIRTVPSEKLLVYNVKEGWEPLCEFLNVPIPAVAFPNTNSTTEFKRSAGIT